MRPWRIRLDLILVLALALLGAGGVDFFQSRQLANLRSQHDADAKSLRELRETLHQYSLQHAAVAPEKLTPEGNDRAVLAQRDATIQQLTLDLTEARASITQLQSQLGVSTDQNAKELASAEEANRKREVELHGRLDALQKELDSVQAESQASRERVAALEAEKAKLLGDNPGGPDRTAAFRRVAASLQDLDQRRDVYLTSIMRRYRDITSQFRAMSGMLDSSRNPNTSTFNSEALTRIQDAISQADDDLRQLSDLNARARQLEKNLSKP
jgi:DNA repair exonuclease SbcCD ATPase subunit